MQLGIWKHLDAEILGREYDKTQIRHVDVQRMSANDVTFDRIEIRDVVEYHVRIGARIKVAPGGHEQAKRRIVELLARELFGDLANELVALEDWAFLEGYNGEMLRRIRRLVDLAEGIEVDG